MSTRETVSPLDVGCFKTSTCRLAYSRTQRQVLVRLLAICVALGMIGLTLLFLGLPTAHSAQPLSATVLLPTAIPPPTKVVPVPTPIFGGEWRDDLLDWQSFYTLSRIGISDGQLRLAIVQYLRWEQTWTGHFESGEFYQAQAISDSVRLAPIPSSTLFYTTGTYTSAVFDATRPVCWYSATWGISGSAYSATVAFRSGPVVPPDGSWTAWIAAPESACSYPLDHRDCKASLSGMDPSRFVQYRVSFESSDASHSPALDVMAILYGVYHPTGTATTKPIPPIDLKSWKDVYYTATLPLGTSLRVDVLANDGATLLSNISSGDSLSSIEPKLNPSIRLFATLMTDDPSRTPELDVWGVRWLAGPRYYFPVIGK